MKFIYILMISAFAVIFCIILSTKNKNIPFVTAHKPIHLAASVDEERIPGALIYDRNPMNKLGGPIFGTVISDFEHDEPGRCSHGGPVCVEYSNGDIVAFHTNTSDHNIDGWSEYAISKDGGQTWNKNNKFSYSYNAYMKDPNRPAWIEEALVTKKGTIVLFVTKFENNMRAGVGVIKSYNNGQTWSDFEYIKGTSESYPSSVSVIGDTNFVLFDNSKADGNHGPHVLYASTDDGATWKKRSTLSLDYSKWYGALVVMANGDLLSGAYDDKDEHHFYYSISKDRGYSWSKEKKSYVDKKIRDPELAFIGEKYYLHGRTGSHGIDRDLFVLYQSDDGIHWDNGIIVSSDKRGPDGYSHNCVINKYNDKPKELMIEYSIIYQGLDTNEYVFFIKPEKAEKN